MGKREMPRSGGVARTAIGCVLGAAVSIAVCMAVLAVESLLIASGRLNENLMSWCVILACFIGGAIGGLAAVRHVGRRTLLVGIFSGVIFCAAISAIGVICFKNVCTEGNVWNCGAVLAGGIIAGLAGARHKKKRRK